MKQQAPFRERVCERATPAATEFARERNGERVCERATGALLRDQPCALATEVSDGASAQWERGLKGEGERVRAKYLA